MGTHNSTYLGIYLEVSDIKVETKVHFYKHTETGKTMKSRFDQNTGVEGIKSERIDIHYEEPTSYIEDNDNLQEDKFWTPAYHGASKRKTIFILNCGEEIKEIENFDLSKLDIHQEIENFKEEYKEYLDYYSKKYNFEIFYGIVNYVH